MKRDVGYIRIHVDCCDDHEAAVDALETMLDEYVLEVDQDFPKVRHARAVLARLRGDSDV